MVKCWEAVCVLITMDVEAEAERRKNEREKKTEQHYTCQKIHPSCLLFSSQRKSIVKLLQFSSVDSAALYCVRKVKALLTKMSECCFPVGRVERRRASGTTYFNLLLMHEFSIIIASPCSSHTGAVMYDSHDTHRSTTCLKQI